MMGERESDFSYTSPDLAASRYRAPSVMGLEAGLPRSVLLSCKTPRGLWLNQFSSHAQKVGPI